MNGERFKVMLQVPDAETSSRKPYAYGCGFATYRKVRRPLAATGSKADLFLDEVRRQFLRLHRRHRIQS